MDRAVFVYTTFPSLVEAEACARVIVDQRLAACANILTSAPFPKFAPRCGTLISELRKHKEH